MQQDHDPRTDLPGAAGPPVEGRRWAWVKVCAWGGAVVVLLCAAAVTTWLVSRVQTALADGPKAAASERLAVEASPVAPPSPQPSPVTVPATVETVVVEQAPPEPPPAPQTERRRPLLMRH
jgi:hypothetical protein